jgi:hydroxymethylbilane synthase
LVQTQAVVNALGAAHRWSAQETSAHIEIVPIKTTGDKITDRALADIGGKGLFAKELEEALFAGEIDIAVHSAKDLPSQFPDGLVLAACLDREDPRDAFLSPVASSIAGLPKGARIGTSSVRRQAQLLSMRPDLAMHLFRGNVDTRLAKLTRGEVDATVLALAGLKRLARESEVTQILDPSVMLPAAAQGAIALEIKADNAVAQSAVAAIDHAPTSLAIAAERAFLGALDGSCRTPLAALALWRGPVLAFQGLALSPDGAQRFDVARSAPIKTKREAEEMGLEAAMDIVERAGRAFLTM